METLKNKLNILEQNKTKKIVLIIGIIVILLLIAGSTYAYYQGTASASISGEAACFDVNYEKGISTNGFKLIDEEDVFNETSNTIKVTDGMALTYVNAGVKNGCVADAILSIYMNVTNLNNTFKSGGECAGALKYIIASYNPSSYSNPSISSMNGISFNVLLKGSITNTGEEQIYQVQLPKNTRDGYIILFYVDGNLANKHNTQGDNWSAAFSATISAVATQGILGQ